MNLKLRELREEREMSQTTLAHIFSIAQTTYSDYERGKVNIPNVTLAKFAEYFETSTDYILGLTDNPNPYMK